MEIQMIDMKKSKDTFIITWLKAIDCRVYLAFLSKNIPVYQRLRSMSAFGPFPLLKKNASFNSIHNELINQPYTLVPKKP